MGKAGVGEGITCMVNHRKDRKTCLCVCETERESEINHLILATEPYSKSRKISLKVIF